MSEPICPNCGSFCGGFHECEAKSPHAKIIDFPAASKYAEPTNVVPATEPHPVESPVLPLRKRPVVGPGVESAASAGTTPKPLSLEHLAQVLLQQQNALAHQWQTIQTLTRTVMDLQHQLGEQAAAMSQLAGQVMRT